VGRLGAHGCPPRPRPTPRPALVSGPPRPSPSRSPTGPPGSVGMSVRPTRPRSSGTQSPTPCRAHSSPARAGGEGGGRRHSARNPPAWTQVLDLRPPDLHPAGQLAQPLATHFGRVRPWSGLPGAWADWSGPLEKEQRREGEIERGRRRNLGPGRLFSPLILTFRSLTILWPPSRPALLSHTPLSERPAAPLHTQHT